MNRGRPEVIFASVALASLLVLARPSSPVSFSAAAPLASSLASVACVRRLRVLGCLGRAEVEELTLLNAVLLSGSLALHFATVSPPLASALAVVCLVLLASSLSGVRAALRLLASRCRHGLCSGGSGWSGGRLSSRLRALLSRR